MERDDIESALRDYIDRTVLRGQGADLTTTMPLFEYGILDSFQLFGLLNFVAERFGVTLRLERLTPDDFATIGSIAAAVQATGGNPVSTR